MMTSPTSTVAITSNGGIVAGMMCLTNMRKGGTPVARAASTYSRSFAVSVAARATRAKITHRVSDRVRMTFVTDGPSTAAIMIASRIEGNAS